MCEGVSIHRLYEINVLTYWNIDKLNWFAKICCKVRLIHRHKRTTQYPICCGFPSRRTNNAELRCVFFVGSEKKRLNKQNMQSSYRWYQTFMWKRYSKISWAYTFQENRNWQFTVLSYQNLRFLDWKHRSLWVRQALLTTVIWQCTCIAKEAISPVRFMGPKSLTHLYPYAYNKRNTLRYDHWIHSIIWIHLLCKLQFNGSNATFSNMIHSADVYSARQASNPSLEKHT